jgi:hypothetical protein
VIRSPSLQKSYSAFFSGDKALEQPPDDLPADATDEQRAEYEKTVKEYLTKLENARETGDWSALIIPGKQPIKFTLRQMPFEGFATVRGMIERKENSEDVWMLVFRLSVVGVEGPGKHEVEFVQHKRFGRIATTSILDKAFTPVDAYRAMIEVATLAWKKAHISPL